MRKFFIFLFCFVSFFINISIASASTKRTYDFNSSSDLTNFFNPDSDPQFIYDSNAGLFFTGAVKAMGYEDILTTKKGFITSPSSDTYKISGFFYNNDNYGYGSIGLSNSDVNNTDGTDRATPSTSVGIVFHGGGGYFVNNGVYTEILWPPDLEDLKWYKFIVTISKTGGNNISLVIEIFKADDAGNLLETKHVNNLDITNSDIANASKLYAYFGTSSVRFSYIDNIQIELTNATFEESGKPTLTSTLASDITTNSANTGGEVLNQFGSSVSARGVCYGINPNPTTSGTCTSNGTGSGTFSSPLTSLLSNTKYYYRAYATNSNGTSYGTENNFTTLTSTQPNSNSSNSNTSSKKRPLKCENKKPSKIEWIKLIPVKRANKEGMEIKWSQQGSDKVTILIDDGSGKFPYVINKTKNDGQEFLVNVYKYQKIKIIPYNGCKKGDSSKEVSFNLYPKGFYNK